MQCDACTGAVVYMYWTIRVIGNIHTVYMRTGFSVVDNKLVINSSRRQVLGFDQEGLAEAIRAQH